MVSSHERRVSALNKGNYVENIYGNVNQKQQYNKLRNELTKRGLFNQTKKQQRE
jgi:exonuclease VII large subunit